MKKPYFLVFSAIITLVISSPQKTWGMEDPSTFSSEPTKITIFSSLQDVASNMVGWVRESALSGCGGFGRWVGSYAKDLPPSYFSKTFQEIDYVHDDLFWQGYFYQELIELKQARFLNIKERERLKEIQEIVCNGLLSPYDYDQGLKELRKKKSFLSFVQNTRTAFQAELKENPDVVLQYLRKDLANSLEEMQNNRPDTNKTLIDFKKKLTYYRNIMNAFDYAENLVSLYIGMEKNKEKIALSEIQYKDIKECLTDALHKINKKQYFKIKEERNSRQPDLGDVIDGLKGENKDVFVKEEHHNTTSFFSYPLFAKGVSVLVRQGASFALEHPMQAITIGLAFQAAAVAAKSSFASPQKSGYAKGGIPSGIYANHPSFFNEREEQEDFKRHNQVQKRQSRSHDMGLVTPSPTQSFITQGGLSTLQTGPTGNFNGNSLNDVIARDLNMQLQGHQLVGSIIGQKDGDPTPIDLAATQGVIIDRTVAYDASDSSVMLAKNPNGEDMSNQSHGNDTASSHPSSKGENILEADIQLKDSFQICRTLSTKIILKDIATKQPVTVKDLQEAHTKKIHLLIFDKTLEDYQHIHPEPTNTSGDYQFSWTPKKPGPYRFWVDITPSKTSVEEYIKVDLQNINFPKDVVAVKTLSQNTTVKGLTYQLSFDPPSLEAGKPAMGAIDITQNDGMPFTQLQPIMGTFAHIVAINEDFENLVHIHPMGTENPGSEERGGPKLQFHLNASKAGFLKIYAQVKIDGKDQFIPFGVEVKEIK